MDDEPMAALTGGEVNGRDFRSEPLTIIVEVVGPHVHGVVITND